MFGAYLVTLLDRYRPQGDTETADIQRVRALTRTATDPYRRDLPLHVTASALIVHPRHRPGAAALAPAPAGLAAGGGHGDPGETDPLVIVAREAAEETGLSDLAPWPDAEVKQVVIVAVPPGKGEPGHEHADIRFFMATRSRRDPPGKRPRPAPLAVPPEARDLTSELNLRQALTRIEPLLSPNKSGDDGCG